jgi:cytochrome c
MGRPAAAIPGFAYSDAMRARGAAGLVWDAATLEHYIADPESVVAGTSMSAPPLRDAHERADLIAYLALSGRYRP